MWQFFTRMGVAGRLCLSLLGRR